MVSGGALREPIRRGAGVLARNREWILCAATAFAAAQGLLLLVQNLAGQPDHPLCIWDCGWYVTIVDHGYDPEPGYTQTPHHPKGDAANWVFFPLFPLAAKGVALTTGAASGRALTLTSRLFFLTAILSFLAFARAWGRREVDPLLAAAVVALHPWSIYGSVGYTEPLFLTLTALALTLLRRRRFVLAGLAIALLSATRLVGLVVALAFLRKDYLLSPTPSGTRWSWLLGVALAPLGLALFMAFLYQLTGDALAFSHVQAAWLRQPPGNPLAVLAGGFAEGSIHGLWAAMVILPGIASVYFLASKRGELAALTFLMTLVPVTTGLDSIPRYIWWQAPFLLFVVEMLANRYLRLLFLTLAIGGNVWMVMAWISGRDFVI